MESLKALAKAGGAKGGSVFTSSGDIRKATKQRRLGSNKYSNGSVLVVGGGRVYSGAPALSSLASNAALSALRTGTGYTTILVEKGIEKVEKSISPNLIVRSFSESAGTAALVKAISSIRHNSMAIGPGMDERGLLHRSVRGIVEAELRRGNIVVLDAGAMKGALDAGTRLTRDAVLTPHMREFEGMGLRIGDESLRSRMAAARKAALENNCVVVLKGHETVISDGTTTRVNRASTAALATMGTGDILSGMIAAYAAMNGNAFGSAVAAVTAHSMLGDLLHRSKGNHVIAMDLIDALPTFLKRFDK